jgi:hypothetical protein
VLKIQDGRLYIIKPNRVTDTELRNVTIAQFIRDFSDEHNGLQLTTNFPHLKVTEFLEGSYSFHSDASDGDTIRIPARQGRPTLSVGGGIGFIANEVRPRDSNGTLMRNAGLDFDVIATKPFNRFAIRTRIGFHSAEPVPSEEAATDSGGREDQAASAAEQSITPTPRSVVEAAQAIAVGLNVDVPAPDWLTLDASQVHISLGFDVSQYWASPTAFVMPDSVPVNRGRRLLTDVFSTAQIDRARDQIDRVVPLRTLVAGPRMRFGGPDNYVFYVIAEYGRRDYLLRRLGVRYRLDANDPDVRTPIDISGGVKTDSETISRYALGIRLTGGIDFKLDVITPLSTREGGSTAQPILRMMIGTPGLSFGN